jgi:hypothetical protein
MEEKLIRLFELYKRSNFYDHATIDLDWLKDKLSHSDFNKLENQIIYIISEYEKEFFINCFKSSWGLFWKFLKTSKASN